jgi:hypothetical protein
MHDAQFALDAILLETEFRDETMAGLRPRRDSEI